MTDQSIEALRALDVLDLAGNPVPLEGILGGKPTVLVWLRHYG